LNVKKERTRLWRKLYFVIYIVKITLLDQFKDVRLIGHAVCKINIIYWSINFKEIYHLEYLDVSGWIIPK
jgi:hypothetical protein